MNTIYDNTFVLGETSATNFIAGNGITIDSPSAGTVRIGNDETVLWDGNNTSIATINLSESLSAFEKIQVDYKAWERIERKTIPTYNLHTLSLQNTMGWGQSSGIDFYNLVYNYELNSSYTTITTVGIRSYRTTSANNWQNSTVNVGPVGIVKVIGINRISGSNA